MTPAITAIKERISEQTLAQEYLELRKSGAEWLTHCLWHKDSTPSLRIYPTHHFCFTCQAHGDIVDLYMALENVTKGAAIRALALRAGVSLDGKPPTREKRALDKRNREFEVWWQRHRVREMGLNLTLMLEGSLWGSRWDLSMQEKCLAYGERLRTIREAKGAELRELATQATAYERNLWKTDKQDAEWWTWWVVAAYTVSANAK